MKNLDFAIRLIGQVPGTTMDIYGPVGQPDYWHECSKLLENSPRKDALRYCGSVKPDSVGSTLAQYDLFFLPSIGENFGYVLLESLAAGCPVLTSDRTPWKNLSALGVGADLSLEMPDAFRSFLESAVSWNEEEMQVRRLRARNMAGDFLRNSKAVALMRELYLSMLDSRRSFSNQSGKSYR